MALVTVDTEKCVNDGLCRDACPGFLIKIDDEGFPYPVTDIENQCVGCGHCVAICPSGALSHADLPRNEFIEMKKELEMSQEAVEQFLKSRRSIRSYLDKSVKREVIMKVIDIARFAPTGHNDQDVQYSIFDNREILKSIADSVVDFMRMLIKTKQDQQIPFDLNYFVESYENGSDIILRHAPVLIVTHCPKMNPAGTISSHIALTTLELAAMGFGLGTCWAGFAMIAAMSGYEPLLELLNLPVDQNFCGAMILGYPKLKYKKVPVRKKPAIYWND